MKHDHPAHIQKMINSEKPDLNQLAGKYELDLLVLLGSYGTENFEPGQSDIDIAFLSRKKLQQNEYFQLIRDLSTFFHYSKLDLIDLCRTSGLLKFEIADTGRLLFQSKQGLFERYRLFCLRYYYDTMKFRTLKKEFFQEQMGELRDE